VLAKRALTAFVAKEEKRKEGANCWREQRYMSSQGRSAYHFQSLNVFLK